MTPTCLWKLLPKCRPCHSTHSALHPHSKHMPKTETSNITSSCANGQCAKYQPGDSRSVPKALMFFTGPSHTKLPHLSRLCSYVSGVRTFSTFCGSPKSVRSSMFLQNVAGRKHDTMLSLQGCLSQCVRFISALQGHTDKYRGVHVNLEEEIPSDCAPELFSSVLQGNKIHIRAFHKLMTKIS